MLQQNPPRGSLVHDKALTSDLRHAVRLFGSLVFTLTSILSLALGTGAATTVFSLTDAVVFEPLRASAIRRAGAVLS